LKHGVTNCLAVDPHSISAGQQFVVAINFDSFLPQGIAGLLPRGLLPRF
jgi:hypothetical protein